MDNDKSPVNKEEIDFLNSNVLKYPDFPKPGILFFDIFSILSNPQLSDIMYKNAVSLIKHHFKKNNIEFNLIIGLESRGFIIGAVLAEKLGVGFAPIRKKSQKNTKLPGKLYSIDYKTEYSDDSFDLQAVSVNKDSKVLLVDDLLATGGSLAATETLVHMAGANVVGTFCVFEIESLKGKNKLKSTKDFLSLISL